MIDFRVGYEFGRCGGSVDSAFRFGAFEEDNDPVIMLTNFIRVQRRYLEPSQSQMSVID